MRGSNSKKDKIYIITSKPVYTHFVNIEKIFNKLIENTFSTKLKNKLNKLIKSNNIYEEFYYEILSNVDIYNIFYENNKIYINTKISLNVILNRIFNKEFLSQCNLYKDIFGIKFLSRDIIEKLKEKTKNSLKNIFSNYEKHFNKFLNELSKIFENSKNKLVINHTKNKNIDNINNLIFIFDIDKNQFIEFFGFDNLRKNVDFFFYIKHHFTKNKINKSNLYIFNNKEKEIGVYLKKDYIYNIKINFDDIKIMKKVSIIRDFTLNVKKEYYKVYIESKFGNELNKDNDKNEKTLQHLFITINRVKKTDFCIFNILIEENDITEVKVRYGFNNNIKYEEFIKKEKLNKYKFSINLFDDFIKDLIYNFLINKNNFSLKNFIEKSWISKLMDEWKNQVKIISNKEGVIYVK